MVGIQWVGRDEELAYADYLCGASFWRVIDTIGLHDTNLTQKEAEDSVAMHGTWAAHIPKIHVALVMRG